MISLLVISRNLAIQRNVDRNRTLYFLLDGDGKVSLSRLQTYLWTIIIISLIFAMSVFHFTSIDHKQSDSSSNAEVASLTSITRIIDSTVETSKEYVPYKIKMPEFIFWVLGINLLSLGVSEQIGTSARKISENQKKEQEHIPSRVIARTQFNLVEIFEDFPGGPLSIGRFQNIFITLVLLTVFVLQTLDTFAFQSHNGGLPPFEEIKNFDQFFIILLGVSHAGYLAPKYYSRVLNPEAADYLNNAISSITSKPDSTQFTKKFSKALQSEISKYMNLSHNNYLISVPYHKDADNSAEKISHALEKRKDLSISKLHETIDNNPDKFGVGSFQFVKNVYEAAFKATENTKEILLDEAKVTKVKSLGEIIPGSIIRMNGTDVYYILIHDITDDSIYFTYSYETHGPHYGSIHIEDWTLDLNNAKQEWYDGGLSDQDAKQRYVDVVTPNDLLLCNKSYPKLN